MSELNNAAWVIAAHSWQPDPDATEGVGNCSCGWRGFDLVGLERFVHANHVLSELALEGMAVQEVQPL